VQPASKGPLLLVRRVLVLYSDDVDEIVRLLEDVSEDADYVILHSINEPHPGRLGQKVLVRLLAEEAFSGRRASARLEMVVRWNRPDLAEEVSDQSK